MQKWIGMSWVSFLAVACVTRAPSAPNSPALMLIANASFPVWTGEDPIRLELKESGFGWVSAESATSTTFSDAQGDIATIERPFDHFRVYADRSVAVWTTAYVAMWYDGEWRYVTPANLPIADDSNFTQYFLSVIGMSARALWVNVSATAPRHALCELASRRCEQPSALLFAVTENFLWLHVDGRYEVQRKEDRLVVGGWRSNAPIVGLPGDRVTDGVEIFSADGTRSVLPVPQVPSFEESDSSWLRESSWRDFFAPDGRQFATLAEIAFARHSCRYAPGGWGLGNQVCVTASTPSHHLVRVFETTASGTREIGHVNLVPSNIRPAVRLGVYPSGIALRVVQENNDGTFERQTFAVPANGP